MTIELLYIEDCPNSVETLHRLQVAVDRTLPGTSVKATMIDSIEKAKTRHFAGSPTILVDGVDLFPSEGRTTDLACRIYFTSDGTAGSPTQEQIEEALTALV